MWLVLIVCALVIIYGLGGFNLWGFEGYRTMLAIFLVIAAAVQFFFRGGVRSR